MDTMDAVCRIMNTVATMDRCVDTVDIDDMGDESRIDKRQQFEHQRGALAHVGQLRNTVTM